MTSNNDPFSAPSPPPAPFSRSVEVTRTAPQGKTDRVTRGLATSAGVLLCLVGALLAMFVIVIATLVILFSLASDSGTTVEPELMLAVALSAIGSAMTWWLGLCLIRGRRRTVLFLRKFRFDDAKEFVTHAAGQALKQRWRLVTLDDLDTAALGTSRQRRTATIAFAVVGLIAAALLIGVAVDVLNSDSTAAQEAAEQAAEDADNPVAAIFAALVVGMVVALATAVAIALAVALITAIAVVVGVFGFTSFAASRSLRRAENDQRGRARSRNELVDFLDRIEEDKGKMFAPRISVLRVINDLWREAVTGLADLSDVVLIDISDPSESLLWEVKTLLRRPDVRLVLIGSAHKVESMLTSGGHDEDDALVLQTLAGRRVLVYDDDQNGFARELRKTLEVSLQDADR